MFREITTRVIGKLDKIPFATKMIRQVLPNKIIGCLDRNDVINCGMLGKPKLGQPRPWGTVTGSDIQLCESFKQDEKVPSENWLPRDGKVINGICGTTGCVYCLLKK